MSDSNQFPVTLGMDEAGVPAAISSNHIGAQLIARGTLRNVLADAAAGRADVRLVRTSAGTELTIADDGKGFDVVTVRRSIAGIGLVSIRERVRLAGGSVSIVTQSGTGTRLTIRIPAAGRPLAVGDRPL